MPLLNLVYKMYYLQFQWSKGQEIYFLSKLKVCFKDHTQITEKFFIIENYQVKLITVSLN